MSDDTQDQFSQPGNPDVNGGDLFADLSRAGELDETAGARNPDWSEIDPPSSEVSERSPLIPAVKSPYPPTRMAWFDVDGMHEVRATLPNAERRLLAERIERIVLRLQETPQYLTNVETLLGLDGLAAQHIGA